MTPICVNPECKNGLRIFHFFKGAVWTGVLSKLGQDECKDLTPQSAKTEVRK